MIGLVGGGTSELGDPSGRATERDELAREVRERNISLITKQMERIFENGYRYAVSKGIRGSFGSYRIVNNADWWGNMTMLTFMRKVGRHMRVSQMMARESVKRRLESPEGISYNEFTYQTLQAYDFWYLHNQYDCNLQLGGSDQWGNITAGTNFIAKMRTVNEQPKKEVYGLTVPLLTNANGEKFGKSTGVAAWLDPKKTSPFAFYQHFVRVEDKVVEKFLHMLTFLPIDEISELMKLHSQNESLRIAQHALAKEVTDLVHGVGYGERAQVASRTLYPSQGLSDTTYSADTIINALREDGHLKQASSCDIIGTSLGKVLRDFSLGRSRRALAAMASQGGVYVGPKLQKVYDIDIAISNDWLIDNRLLLARVGKSDFLILELI
ncbi:hypothetical protein V1511DRAFT_522185 [Dipodascopsis uninucleata]